MYYAFSFDEQDRVEKCIRDGKDFGKVNLMPQKSDEFPDHGWLVWEPHTFSCDAKDYASYDEALEDFLWNLHTSMYERDNGL